MDINMKKIITFFTTTILLIAIAGCANNITKNNSTIHAKEFMNKSEQVVQETLKIGPVISKSKPVNNAEKKRIFVSREEVADYTSINNQIGIQDGIFNITINLDYVDIRAAMKIDGWN